MTLCTPPFGRAERLARTSGGYPVVRSNAGAEYERMSLQWPRRAYATATLKDPIGTFAAVVARPPVAGIEP